MGARRMLGSGHWDDPEMEAAAQAPSLPGTQNPAQLTLPGQNQEQKGLLLLCGKKVEFQQAQEAPTRSQSY